MVDKSDGLESGSQAAWHSRLSAKVTRRYAQTGFPQQPTVTAKTSAVLVLLSEGADGVQVLLTERGSALRNYPGQLCLPGGGRDDTDTDPVSNALREAYEEVGLEPTSVHVLGLLPPVTDSKAKFVVVPVLAWSPQPVFAAAMSEGEVAAIWNVPIRDLAPTDTSTAPERSEHPMPSLGYMTTAIIDLVWALVTSTDLV